MSTSTEVLGPIARALKLDRGVVAIAHKHLEIYIAKTAPKCADAYATLILMWSTQRETEATRQAVLGVNQGVPVERAFERLMVDAMKLPSFPAHPHIAEYVDQHGRRMLKERGGESTPYRTFAHRGPLEFSFVDLPNGASLSSRALGGLPSAITRLRQQAAR